MKVVQCYDYVNTPVLNSQKEKQTDHKYIDLGPENKKVFLKYVSKKPKLIKLRSDGSFKKELYDYIVNKQQQYTEVKWDSEDL